MMGENLLGRHVYANLYGISRETALDAVFLKNVVHNALKKAGIKPLEIKSWIIPGKKGGVSIIAVLHGSHVTLHAWSEYNYATLDVYLSKEHGDPWVVFNSIISSIKPSKYTVKYSERRL